MVILNMKLDNVLSFNDFQVNFSYPKQVKTSIIENENLKNIPTFRYKKLNVFVGSNASGKTSLVKCIWMTLLFLARKEKQAMKKIINYNDKPSKIEIDLVNDTNDFHELHRFKILVTDKLNKDKDIQILISHAEVKLSSANSSKDSYETKSKELDEIEDNYQDYLDALREEDKFSGWNVTLPATEEQFDHVNFIGDKAHENEYLQILNSLFKTLDNSIDNVKKSKDATDAYVVTLDSNKKIIIQDGMRISAIPLLSSGTKYAINIANIIYSIKFHMNGIYLIDEQFSYVNSDVEAAILSTMVSMLGPNEQIFFTTHNINILGLGFPFHSFYFMKKEIYDGKTKIIINCGSEANNKNNMSPRTIIDNDLFATAPDTNRIFMLGEE